MLNVWCQLVEFFIFFKCTLKFNYILRINYNLKVFIIMYWDALQKWGKSLSPSISGDNIERTKKKILVLYLIDKFLMQFDLLLWESSLNVFMLENTSCDYIHQVLKCCIFLKNAVSVICFCWFYLLYLKRVKEVKSEIQKQDPGLVFWYIFYYFKQKLVI